MDIKDFVKQVLGDLVDAVDDVGATSTREMNLAKTAESRTVEFDIAVSVENGSDVNGKAGIKVLEFVEAGANVSESSKNSSVTRIKFGVNIDSETKQQTEARRAKFAQDKNRHLASLRRHS